MVVAVILLRLLITVLLCFSSTASAAWIRSAQRPPRIIREPDANWAREKAYKEGEDILLACVANPESNAVYTWKKDGQFLDLSRPKYQRLTDQGGSFMIKNPSDEDEGVYQCFATNQFGTAVTVKSMLKKAVLDPFPTVTEVQVHRPTVGRHLVLECRPPDSYPSGNIYWGVSRPGSNQLKAIDNNDRVVLGYDGYLYITNVMPTDNRHGYVCLANNPVLGAHVQGQDQRVEPQEKSGSPTYIAPHMLWTSDKRDVAIRGQNKKMKCVFAGLPTPRVTWTRLDSSTSRHRETREGYGTEIEFTDVQYADAGTYRCSASNDGGPPTTHEDLVLVVESSPHWRHGKPPSDLNVDDENDVDVECEALGRPRPDVTWSINGTSVSSMLHDSRRSVEGNRLIVRNVNPNDAGVLQCMAENEHGSILANAFLTVLATPPSFTETPRDLKVVEGQTATMTCNVDGSPRPRITWSRGTPPRPVASGNRFTILPSGSLEITDAALNDGDLYHCNAVNKYGSESASSSLAVRRPTTILTPVERDVIANVTDDVRLPCDVQTDPAERENLVVEWRRDGVAVDPSRDRHLDVDSEDFSLHISGARVTDTASYVCHADNGLDQATSEPTNVVVRGRPEPPRDVRVLQCSSTFIDVTFETSGDNNSPILEYIVYHTDSSREDPDEQVVAKRLVAKRQGTSPGTTLTVGVPAKPWVKYEFYVVARNSLGLSDKTGEDAHGEPAVCVTPETAPQRNPDDVCTRLGRPNQLVIVWKPVPRDEHNGEGFHYRVAYRPLGSREQISTSQVTTPTSSQLIVYDVPVFQKYEIFVQSVNRIGEAPILGGERKVGYSGEGRPLNVPDNLRLLRQTMNSTYAEFTWDGVDTSVEQVRGFFRGYQIQFWRVDHPSDVRSQDIEVGPPADLCPPLNIFPEQRRRRRQAGSPVVGAVDQLWPFSMIRAGVLVLNQGSKGTLGDTIDFETPEGVPSAVASMEVVERGSNHLNVSWTPPEFPNGRLLPYIIEYNAVRPNVHVARPRRVICDPGQTSRGLLDLEPDTLYAISLRARTAAGLGPIITAEDRTLEMSDPDKPAIGSIVVGENSANVSWRPAEDEPTNPGARFYVEYVKVSDADGPWNRSDPTPEAAESGQNWAHIGNLTPGEEYYFRVVAVNGIEPDTRETRSDPPWKEVITPHVATESTPRADKLEDDRAALASRASVGWFIILMCIIILLLVILILACIIQRRRGQTYPVYEKERERGHDPYAPEDQPFGEYTRNNEPSDYGQGSLDDDEKPLESESDSLGEYEDQDPSKFNEDGSFIGQYTRRGGGRTGAPGAYNTFV